MRLLFRFIAEIGLVKIPFISLTVTDPDPGASLTFEDDCAGLVDYYFADDAWPAEPDWKLLVDYFSPHFILPKVDEPPKLYVLGRRVGDMPVALDWLISYVVILEEERRVNDPRKLNYMERL